MDESIKCSKCEHIIPSKSKYCTRCGTHRPIYPNNFCTNLECERCIKGFKFHFMDMYCDECGSLTTFGKKT